jgi:hypothetical protein
VSSLSLSSKRSCDSSISGIDYYSIAATGLPNYFPINFVLRAERGDVFGGCSASSGEAGCR